MCKIDLLIMYPRKAKFIMINEMKGQVTYILKNSACFHENNRLLGLPSSPYVTSTVSLILPGLHNGLHYGVGFGQETLTTYQVSPGRIHCLYKISLSTLR